MESRGGGNEEFSQSETNELSLLIQRVKQSNSKDRNTSDK